MTPRTAQVLSTAVITGAFRKGWQGPTLLGSLRGLTVDQLLWRPAPKRKCVWEQALHAAYWKYAVARIIAHAAEDGPHTVPGFPRSPSNWPRLPARPDQKAWKQDLSLLKIYQKHLERVVGALTDEALAQPPSPKHKHPTAFYVAGAAAHDAYHCGQVQLMKRLMRP